MSWAADRVTIKAAIDGLSGYIIIPQNKEPEDAPGTHNHRAYSLKLKGVADLEWIVKSVNTNGLRDLWKILRCVLSVKVMIGS